MSAPRTRNGWIAGVLLAGVLAFLVVVEAHYPLEQWLALRYARALALAAVFGAACLAAGHAFVVRALGRTLPLEEHVSIAFAVGLFAFFAVSFAVGLVGLYGPPFFVLGPVLLLAFGGGRLLATLGRVSPRRARSLLLVRPGPIALAALLFGSAGVGLLWFNALSPRNASYDARWYHLPLAEHYVASGGITAFREGWVPGALPQLASLVYVWPFSMPGTLFDKVVTAAHLEILAFVMTLVGVNALVRRVLGRRVPLAWTGLFLFPGIFCYDSGLVLGADHWAAVFAPPIFLLALRLCEAPSAPFAWLLAIVSAGALNTKYTAAPLVLLPVVLVVTRFVRAPTRRPELLRALLTTLGAGLVLTTPHWLKNLVFYGDPLFPVLRHWLPASPWSEAAEAPHRTWFSLRHPPFGLAGLGAMAKTFVTFSFVPHDYPQYHGAVPVFGSLFTLLSPVALFFRRRHRLLWLFAASYLAIAGWFWIHALDRYLQAWLPWMAAATLSVLVLVWQLGGFARYAAALAVAVQLVWGADVAFIPAHRAAGAPIQAVVIELLGQGYRKNYADRLVAYPEWEAIGRALPPNAKVLVHEEEIHLGLSARSALDYSGDQGAFYWGEPGAATPAEIYATLRAHDITHLVWAKNLDHATDTPAAGLAFFDFATNHAKLIGTYGGFNLAALPANAPERTEPGDVAFYPCEPTPFHSTGLYRLHELARAPGDRRPFAAPAAGVNREQALERASFAVYDAGCQGALPPAARARFELLAARGPAMLLARKPSP